MKKRGGRHERTIREFRLERGRHPRRRAPARVPRRPDRRAGLRGTADPLMEPRARDMSGGQRPRDAPRAVLAPTDQGCARPRRRCCAPAGIEARVCATFDALLGELARGAAALVIAEEAAVASATARALAAVPARSSRPGPICRCWCSRGRAPIPPTAARGGAHARQRHAARAAAARHDAAQRGPHGAARPRAPVPDSRPPRGARARRRGAARRRPAQGRVPRDARPRAAQSARAAAHGSAAAEAIGRRPAIPRAAPGDARDGAAGHGTSSASWTTCSRCRASPAA